MSNRMDELEESISEDVAHLRRCWAQMRVQLAEARDDEERRDLETCAAIGRMVCSRAGASRRAPIDLKRLERYLDSVGDELELLVARDTPGNGLGERNQEVVDRVIGGR